MRAPAPRRRYGVVRPPTGKRVGHRAPKPTADRNTAHLPGSARVTLVFEDAAPRAARCRAAAQPPQRRRLAGIFPKPSAGASGSDCRIARRAAAPIVVERAMYYDAGGVVWAAGSNLVATRLSGQVRVPVILAPLQHAGPAVPPVTVAGILGGDPNRRRRRRSRRHRRGQHAARRSQRDAQGLRICGQGRDRLRADATLPGQTACSTLSAGRIVNAMQG